MLGGTDWVADRLVSVLFGGDRVGELAPQTRRLLDLLATMTPGERDGAERDGGECWFTRRQARDHTGWSDFALRRHLARLVDLELVAVRRHGHAFSYLVLWHPDHDHEARYDANRDGDAMGSRGRNVRAGSRSR